jgi:hypothetical protein
VSMKAPASVGIVVNLQMIVLADFSAVELDA